MQRDLLRAAEAGSVPAMRAVAGQLAAQHQIRLEFRETMPDTAAGFFDYRRRTAVAYPITDEETFAVVCHEIGHGLAGECSGVEPHRRDRSVTQWWMCIRCEVDAWTCALGAVPFSKPMFERLRNSLANYRRRTPASASALQDLDIARGSLMWKASIQKHRARQWRAEWMRSINGEVERDRQRRRIEEDAESRARMARLFPQYAR